MMKFVRLLLFLMVIPMDGMRVMFAQRHVEEERPVAPPVVQSSIIGHIMPPSGAAFTDAQYKEMARRVTRDPGKIIAKKAIHSIEMKAYRYREALLPALFLWRGSSSSLSIADYMAKRIEKVKQKYLDNRDLARTLPAKTIVSVNFLSKEDVIITADLRKPETDYVKLIGRKLMQNEAAIIGYADGTYDIKLSEIERDVANNFSHEQLDCIIDLYRSPRVDWLMRFWKYESIISTLPLNTQIVLAANYNVKWFVKDEFSTVYEQYTAIEKAIKNSKQEKLDIEAERARIKDERSWHEWNIQRDKNEAARRKEERRNRPFWKRHGHVMLASIAAFAVGWMSKNYWGTISTAGISCFNALKSKWSYRQVLK